MRELDPVFIPLQGTQVATDGKGNCQAWYVALLVGVSLTAQALMTGHSMIRRRWSMLNHPNIVDLQPLILGRTQFIDKEEFTT